MTNAAKIGARYSCSTLAIGLILAFLIFFWLDGDRGSLSTKLLSIFEFIKEFAPSFLSACLSLGLSAYWLGRWAGVKILVDKTPHVRVGIFVALLTLLIGTLAGSMTTLFIELADKRFSPSWQWSYLSENIFDYIVKPLYWVFLLGSIPAMILGWIYARSLDKLLPK